MRIRHCFNFLTFATAMCCYVFSLINTTACLAETPVVAVPGLNYPGFTPRKRKPFSPARDGNGGGAFHGTFDPGGYFSNAGQKAPYGNVVVDACGNVLSTSVHFPTGDKGFENFHFYEDFRGIGGGAGGYSQRELPEGRVPITDYDKYHSVDPEDVTRKQVIDNLRDKILPGLKDPELAGLDLEVQGKPVRKVPDVRVQRRPMLPSLPKLPTGVGGVGGFGLTLIINDTLEHRPDAPLTKTVDQCLIAYEWLPEGVKDKVETPIKIEKALDTAWGNMLTSSKEKEQYREWMEESSRTGNNFMSAGKPWYKRSPLRWPDMFIDWVRRP